MAHQAKHLVWRVLPPVRTRQWVLTCHTRVKTLARRDRLFFLAALAQALLTLLGARRRVAGGRRSPCRS